MSHREEERTSLLNKYQRGTFLRHTAISKMDVEKKNTLYPLTFLSNLAFGNERFAARRTQRITQRYGLPPAHTIDTRLETMILCSQDVMHTLVVKLGLLILLKQLPRLMKREDIQTLNAVFGTDTVVFAMENRHLAPQWSHHILRLPDNLVMHAQAVRYGWMALLRWMENTYPDHHKWFVLRMPQDFEALRDSFPLAEAAFPAVEKALGELEKSIHNKNTTRHDAADGHADAKPLSLMPAEEAKHVQV